MALNTPDATELTREQVATILTKPLEQASVFLAAGPRIFDTTGPLRVPGLPGAGDPAELEWVGESELIPEWDTEFSDVQLLPSTMKSVKVLTRYSNELARQSIVSLEQTLRDRLVADVAGKLDAQFLSAEGGGVTTPRGLFAYEGATDTAVSDQRMVVNPMLDSEFLDIAARLRPQDKAGSRFLAALQMELDPELGRLPLDGRPAPAAYVDPPRWQPALDAFSLGRRAGRKALQRLRRGNRPPAGGTVMAGKVVEHWRTHPETLDPLVGLGFVRDRWVEEVLAGRIEPRAGSVAFLTNLVVATSSRASVSATP